MINQVNEPTNAPQQEEEWYLKDITFNNKPTKIICQNLNGPCSFIAICNVLLLRGDITLASQRESVTYAYMAQHVGDYLLDHCPGVDVGAALSMMPKTTRGMDLNPLFTGSRDFRPSGDGGALALFQHAGIDLVHGWLVDSESPEYASVAAVGDYDTAVNLIAEADHITGGQLVLGESDVQEGGSSSRTLSTEHRAKVQDAIHVQTFLDNTSSQLTYRGLFDLASSVPPGQLIAFFRNSHLSVLYKPVPGTLSKFPDGTAPSHEHPHFSSNNPFADLVPAAEDKDVTTGLLPESSGEPTSGNLEPAGPAPASHVPSPAAPGTPDPNALFLLVTDSSFLREPTVVWETLRDVDGQTSAFFDAKFMPARPVGGDFAGYSRSAGSPGVGDLERGMASMGLVEDSDQQLAIQLQREEEAHAQQAWERQQQQRQERAQQQEAEQQRAEEQRQRAAVKAPKMKRKGSCLIM